MGTEEKELAAAKILSFRRGLPSHFNKPNIIDHVTAPIPAKPVNKSYVEKVTCKVGSHANRTDDALLHMDPLNGEFKVTSPTESWKAVVRRDDIVAALNETVKSRWAHVKGDNRYVTLDRDELLKAFNKLDAKLQRLKQA